MVMVEVMVPALDKEYDFQLDENASIDILIEEITEMVCHREQIQLVGEEKKMMLCHLDGQRVLPRDQNLCDLGIKTGNRLMLV